MTNNLGFTLIELLVVVLIIAILAVIALPKYQLTVEKTHAVNAYTRLKAINDSIARYYLATGSYSSTASKWSVLDIELPEGCSDGGYCQGDIWVWYMYANSGNTLANRSPANSKYFIHYDAPTKRYSCYANASWSNSTFYGKVCGALCGTAPTNSTCYIN